jgi:hypothetical protein
MPTDRNAQTFMSQKGAAAPGLNVNGQIGLMSWTPRIVALTGTAQTLKAADSGTIYHNVGLTASITVTLPAISAGPFYFKILQGAGYSIVVTAETADTMITFNDAQADSVTFSSSNEIIGGHYEVFCDGTSLFVLPILASEAQTVTIVTS